MPTINKPKYKRQPRNTIDSKVYRKQRWVKLREQVLRDNPSCFACLCEGTYNDAEHCHHSIPILVDPDRAYDYSNIMPLCRACHEKRHEYLRKNLHDPVARAFNIIQTRYFRPSFLEKAEEIKQIYQNK